MPLTLFDWVYGISQIAAVCLSVIAGLFAVWMFREARSQELLRAWKYLCAALVLFSVEEVLGLLRTFGVYNAFPWLPELLVDFLTKAATHIVPFFILLFLIAALVIQANIKRGWTG